MAGGANWLDDRTTGGITGVVPLAADSVVFNQSTVNGVETISVDAATAIAGMTFGNTGATTLQSDSTTSRVLTLGTGGITITGGAGAVTIGNATNGTSITLGDVQAWTNNSANLFSVLNALTATTNALTIAGTGATTISGAITSTVAVGSVAFTIGTGAASGTLVNLTNAANAIAGDIAINGGTLQYTGGTATTTNHLGVGSGSVYRQILLTNGGTFQVSTADFNVNVVSTTNKGAGFVFNIGAGGGTFLVDAGRTFTVDDGTTGVTGTGTTAQQLQGSGTLTKAGTGVLVLRQQFNFAGAIIVSAGTLRLSGVSGGLGQTPPGPPSSPVQRST